MVKKSFTTRVLMPTDDVLYYCWRVSNIVDLYREAHPGGVSADWQLNSPKSTRLVYTSGDIGGVLLDPIRKNYEPEIVGWRVMFAAFEGKNQKQGRLRACLEKAEEKGLDIIMVDMNPFDNFEVWEKVGFPHCGTCGFTLVVTKTIMDGICYASEKYEID